MTAAKYEATVTLPTNGNLYGDDGPDVVVLRAMTTQEEKMLYGSSSGTDRLRAMVRACVVEPVDFDINGLIGEDFYYLLVKLRILTYGPEYKIETVCPYCHHENKMTINLDEDLIVNELPKEFSEPISIKLPKSGDTVECKLLRMRDNNTVDKLAKKLSKNGTVSSDEIAYTYRLAKSIVSLNGKEIDFPEAQQYVQRMHAMDSAYINSRMNKIHVGYDRDIEIDACGSCGEPYEATLPLSGEFFRPSFD